MTDLDAIRALHVPHAAPSVTMPTLCSGCGDEWPCDTAIVLAALDAQEFHDDGDECTGLSCGNPGHGWDAAIEREARLRAAVMQVGEFLTLHGKATGRSDVNIRKAVTLLEQALATEGE